MGTVTDTKQLLAELRSDHRNMSIVLDVLEQVIESADSGADPNFELVDEIMRYMTVYPDAVHHPKEDVVYADLQTRRPDLADGLEDVPGEHRRIAELGKTLRGDVEAIVAGAAVRRDLFVADASDYVENLRRHIYWEEQDLFKRVDEMLDAKPAKVDVEQLQRIKDPVFELEVESGFQRLIGAIQSAV